MDNHEGALQRLGDALGEAACLLDVRLGGAEPSCELAADWDCCFVGSSRVETLACWRELVLADRLDEVEGAFALAWTSEDRSVSLARDAIGERSLYYALVESGLVFASTLSALLATSLVRPWLNFESIPVYLSYGYVPGRDTLVQGIHELLPGEVVSYRAGRLERRRIWNAPGEETSPRPEDVYVDELQELLERAVARRLPASGCVAASLSGGIDSSAVVALARTAHEGQIVTYGLSFGPQYPNETGFSSLVAKSCEVEHRVLEVGQEEVMERFDETVRLLSKPIGEPLTVPNLLLFREAAAAGAQVVLNGEGGDPCFGGPKNAPMILSELYGEGGGVFDPYRRERQYLRAHRKCYSDLAAMLEEDVAATLSDDPLESTLTDPLEDPRWPSLVGRLMALNVAFKGAHHILSKVDHLSSGCGVLPRSPLFDRAVTEAALRMPAGLRLRGKVEKYVLKRAVEDLLPDAVLRRPKSGMRVPIDGWLQGHFGHFARERILEGLPRYGIFRSSYLEELVDTDGSTFLPRRAGKIWLLLSLEAWLRTVLEASTGPKQPLI